MFRKTFKYRIYPTQKQVGKLDNTLDLCRELYNSALQERRDAWKLNKINISKYDQILQLPEIKQERKEYNDIYAQVLQDVLARLDKSFKSFFNRVKKKVTPGFPRFQNNSRYNSFTYSQHGFSITDKGKLKLSKIGEIKMKLHRNIIGKTKTCSIIRENTRWYVCFSVEIEPIFLEPINKSIGIDLGMESFLTLSDGTSIDNDKYYQSQQKKLRVAQRKLSRRKKGSNRRNKAKNILANIHKTIFNRRNDFQHKISHWLVNHYDTIVIEKLNINKMISNNQLNKQITDVSWYSFIQKLRYKAEYAGRKLIEVNPAYTSQMCSNCKVVKPKKLSERQHICDQCGLNLHRDHNASINILNLGLGLSLQELT